jgi:secreted trypsin-like serine protease
LDSSEEICNPKPQDVPVEQLIPHPDYNNPRFANDIGIIRLSQEPDMSRFNVAPVCLPFSNMAIQQKTRYTVIGWGITETGRKSNVLLKVSVPFVPNDECQRIHGRSIQLGPGQVCFGGEGIRDR